MAAGLAKLAAKISVAGGVVYWSIQQGIWGTTKEGSDAGKRLSKAIVQPAKEYVEKIPSLTGVNTSAKDYWNTGSIFKGLAPADIAKNMPGTSLEMNPAPPLSIQKQLSCIQLPEKPALSSPHRGLIANISPPTPTFMLPSPNKQVKSGDVLKDK